MAEPFLGEIRLVGFNFAPAGWYLCQGQLLSISQNTALFSLLGTTYGGNGTTTFALPNLQSRLPIHQGTDTTGISYPIGSVLGSEGVTLATNQIGSHTHSLVGSSAAAVNKGPGGGYSAAGSLDFYTTDSQSADLVPLASNAISPMGGSAAHSNIMPYQCVNFIIAYQGVFPSRN